MKTNQRLSKRTHSCPDCARVRQKYREMQKDFASRDDLFNELRRLRAFKYEYDMERLSPPHRTQRQKLRAWMFTGYWK